MITLIILWFVFGIIVGAIIGGGIVGTRIALYGDEELNKKIDDLRQSRLDIEELRYKVTKAKTLKELRPLLDNIKDFLEKEVKKGES